MDYNNGRIQGIHLYNLKIPITTTYHLSFGDVDFFETTIVEVTSGDQTTYGESTPLPGYGHETNQSVWNHVSGISRKILDMGIKKSKNEINKYSIDHPFASSSLLTGLEILGIMLEGKDFFEEFQPKRHNEIPLIYPITTYDPEKILKELEEARRIGHRNIKVKVGSPGHSIEEEISKISIIADNAPGIRIRIDANQGLDFKAASKILKEIGDFNIELFEQPFPTDSWEKMKKLYQKDYGIPLMLDESIEGIQDLEKAEKLHCTDYVKFKLMKQMSFENLFSMIQKAQDFGFDIIIGNGVQGEIGCIYEANVLSTLEKLSAGENNGFLKQKEPLLNNTLQMEKDSLLVKDLDIQLNPQIISKYLVKEEKIGKKS